MATLMQRGWENNAGAVAPEPWTAWHAVAKCWACCECGAVAEPRQHSERCSLVDVGKRSDRQTKEVLDALRAAVLEADRYPVGTHDGCVKLLAKLATMCEKAADEVQYLQETICEANNVLFDTHAHDVEHTMKDHADWLPETVRTVASGAVKALETLSPVVGELVGG